MACQLNSKLMPIEAKNVRSGSTANPNHQLLDKSARATSLRTQTCP